jgi:rod shape-determining protein MreD
MERKKIKPYFAVCFTFLIASVITIFPLSSNLWWLKPHWLTLVLIYWVIFLPNVIGVIAGFFVGILIDLLKGTPFGSTGLVLAFIAFLTIMLRMRLRQFRFWQQFAVVIFLVGLEQLLYLWLQLALGSSSVVGMKYWSSAGISIIMWPILFLLLRSYQRRLKLL